MATTTCNKDNRPTLYIYKNDGRTYTFYCQDSDGVAVAITSATVSLTMWTTPEDTAATFTVSGTVTDGSGGICTVAITSTQTATRGQYICRLSTTLSGTQTTWGEFILEIQ